MNPILIMLIGQAINMVVGAVNKGGLKIPDAVPIVGSLVDALGHASGETDAERAQRQADAAAIFAKHADSLLPPDAPKP